MKRLLTLIASLFILCSAHAGDVKVEAVIAVDGDTKPATSFASDTPKLQAFFRSKGTEKGDKLRGVWIAEDVGDAAPANTKIDEATVTADEDNFHGAFSLSKPTKGWPVGKYKVEIYDEDNLSRRCASPSPRPNSAETQEGNSMEAAAAARCVGVRMT